MTRQPEPGETHPHKPASRPHISWVDRIEYAVRSRGAKVVVLALVANTMVAQLLYNSAGQLVLGSAFLLGYLLFSAVCSTVAFALFEVSTIFQLHDLHTFDASTKAAPLGRWRDRRRWRERLRNARLHRSGAARIRGRIATTLVSQVANARADFDSVNRVSPLPPAWREPPAA